MELSNDSHFTIKHLAPLIRRRKISPIELTEFVLRRIAQYQPVLNPFISVTAKQARTQARQAEKEIARGHYRGPLHGIPISLKDLFHTRGIRTTAGSKILRNFVPKENAVVVDRLLDAGAVLVGKTNLHEFAYGATNVSSFYGPVLNPWNPERISGGSSGGSAVSVTCALALASLGTDTGGSIRIPSAACGCVGLKPTYGCISLEGVIPLATTLDHAGPLCRCTEDAAILMNILAEPAVISGKRRIHYDSELKKGLKGLIAGIPRQYFFDQLQAPVRKAVLDAIEMMRLSGIELREVDLKSALNTTYLGTEITNAESLAYHLKWLESRPQDYGEDIRTRLLAGKNQLASTYVLAQQARRAYAEEFAHALQEVDVLVAPTIPMLATRPEETEIMLGHRREQVRKALLGLTRPANLTGFPAVSVPCGFAKSLPVGLQITGRPWEEAKVLRAAYGYEQQTDWHKRFPPVFC